MSTTIPRSEPPSALTRLKVRNIPFQFGDDTPFQWNPANPLFGFAMNALSFIAPPYDLEWGINSDSDQTTWGTTVTERKPPEPRFNVTANVGNGGSAWASAGLGKWFRPIGTDSTWVRIGLYAPYVFDWRTDSNWFAAHTSAFLGIYVQSFDSNGGDPQDEVNRTIPLWSDGTGWLEDHSDSGDGYYPSDTYFLARSSRWYAIWAWAHTQGDAHSGSLAYSYSWGTLSVSLPFMVLQQWT